MVNDNHTENAESLGDFLLRCRKEKKLGIEDIVEETKIPYKTLLAMEASDYQKLPSDAFARGFYILYANVLDLDAKDILERYSTERGIKPKIIKSSPPLKQGKTANVLAARPPVAIGSALGFGLVLLIVLFAALCYHFSWNPATFLSAKLRNLQTPTIYETQQENETAESIDVSVKATELPPDTNYFLQAKFLTDTTLTIAIDDSFPEKQTYTRNSSQSWNAREAITLIFPETAMVNLSLNGALISLPPPEDGYITLSLP